MRAYARRRSCATCWFSVRARMAACLPSAPRLEMAPGGSSRVMGVDRGSPYQYPWLSTLGVFILVENVVAVGRFVG